MEIPVLEYVASQLSYYLEGSEYSESLCSDLDYESDDDLKIKRASEKLLCRRSFQKKMSLIRNTIMELIHGVGHHNPAIAAVGIGLGNVTTPAKVLIAVHYNLVSVLNYERLGDHDIATAEPPPKWQEYQTGPVRYKFKNRVVIVTIFNSGELLIVHFRMEGSLEQEKGKLLLLNMVPTFRINDADNDFDRLAYMNLVICNLHTTLVLKVINRTWRNPDSYLTPPANLVPPLSERND